MQTKKTEIYRVEREQRKLPVTYEKVSFGLSGKELEAFPAGFSQADPEKKYEAVCRVAYDMSGWME